MKGRIVGRVPEAEMADRLIYEAYRLAGCRQP
jgi:hypothetical protein